MKTEDKKVPDIDLSPYWCDPDKKGEDLARAVNDTVEFIAQDTSYILTRAKDAGALYNNCPPAWTDDPARVGSLNGTTSYGNPLSLNVVKSVIDALSSRVGKNRPSPRFVTDCGDDALQDRARKLTRYVRGVIDKENVYSSSKRVIKDACTYGDGAFHVFQDASGIRVERADVNELLVDSNDGHHGSPRELFRRKRVSRLTLQQLYPEHAGDIASEVARNGAPVRGPGGMRNDMVDVFEAWHLPLTPDSKDGRYVLCTQTCVLIDEVWDRPRFPFIFLRWNSNPLEGFFSTGVPWDLCGLQGQINTQVRMIAKANRLAVPKLLLDSKNSVSDSMEVDGIGSVVKVDFREGQEPKWWSPPQVVSGDAYKFLWDMYQRAFEMSGVSQMQATGNKPSGLYSAAAQREYNDTASERFASFQQDIEDCFVQLAEAIIDESKRFYGPNDKVNLTGKGHIETIKWKDVDMDRDKFNLKVFPVSGLSQHPAARLAEVQELADAGVIDQETMTDLLGDLDVNGELMLAAAPYNNAFHIVGLIINEQKYTAPNRYMKLNTCIKLGLNALNQCYAWAERDYDIEEMLEQFIDECEQLEKASQDSGPRPIQQGLAPLPPPGPAEGLPPDAGAVPPPPA